MNPVARSVVLAALLTLPAACARTDHQAAAEPTPAKPVAVGVTTVTRRTVPELAEPVGTVRARKRSVLSSKIVATVVAVRVVEGDRVHAGDILATLDDRDTAAQLRRAQAAREEARQSLEEADRALQASERAQEAARAQHELARATLARYRRLFERELIAAQDHEEMGARARVAAAEVARLAETHASLVARRSQSVARIEQADAEVETATVVAAYTKVVAPFDGIVVAKPAEVGTLASPGAPLFTIEEERYRLEASVEESHIGRIHVGDHATVSVDALGADRSARVIEIVPAADPASRTFIVKLELPAERDLRSGLYGHARFVIGERSVLTAPASAIVERGQLQRVVVIDTARRAQARLIKTGKTIGDDVEVLSGLAEGERVVTSGGALVADGTVVEPRG